MGTINWPPDMGRHLAGMSARIKNLEIGIPRLYSEVLKEQANSSGSIVDLNGPSVTIQVTSNAFVYVYAQSDIRGASQIYLSDSASDFVPAIILGEPSVDSPYYTVATSPGNSQGATPPLSGPLIFSASEGTHTYTLLYKGASADSAFKNRKLWVWTLG